MKTEKPSFKNFINMESKNPLDLAAYAQAELNQQAHLEAAELKSIKVSIYESPLKDYFPDKDMSFHDKVIFAIHKVCELSALQQENEKLRANIRDTKLRPCPNCNSVDDVIMFTSDLDICNRCNKTF
jgi:hypothetical protein